MVVLIALWVFFSFVIALYGSQRKIGFSKSLLSAVFLTPLIGLIITSLSKNEKDIAKKEQWDKQTKEYLDAINSNKKV